MPEPVKSVLVTGDVIIDHHIYAGERRYPVDSRKAGSHIHTSEGGAALLYHILTDVAKSSRTGKNRDHRFKVHFGLKKSIFNELPAALQGYALWRPCSYSKEQREIKVWRTEQTLGYGDACGDPVPYAKFASNPAALPELVVIDDGGLGFRQSIQKKAWPAAIQNGAGGWPQWILLKMSSPVGQGDLWRHLKTEHRERLVVVVSINDIRREEVKVSRGISWERTALDLVEELCANSEINELLSCRHLIVHFSLEGAVHVDLDGSRRSFHLIYDPGHLERDWSARDEGNGLGYMACLTSGIVSRLIHSGQSDQIHAGIRAGLSAMRTMHHTGHGTPGCGEPGFPYEAVVRDIQNPGYGFATVKLPDPGISDPQAFKNWSILTAVLEDTQKNPRPLYGIGRRVAVVGPRALTQIPCARFGGLFTADRFEIESLRSIRMLLDDYVQHDKGKRPLNIAVFGPPGAGKSFGICQIAKGILGEDVPILEFNLSQFKSPSDLIGAFHQVRDQVLLGTTPVVFWDEFDAEEYRWLQYLLAPMQDGKFLDGQISHPIGKSIFVFAGGTSYDMENFGPKETEKERWDIWKLKKGPDFKSRLSGYLNVLGPNRRQHYNPEQKEWLDDPEDICFPVRRALLIRGLLKLKEEQRLDIDRGILSALIEIGRYRHGARSLEKIILQLKKPGESAIRRSDLPADEILALNTDPVGFKAIFNRNLKFKTHAEDLAPCFHQFYRELGRKEGWLKPELDKGFDDLPVEYKQDNRAAAARIPHVLDLVGLYVVEQSFPKSQPLQEITDIIEENVDLLAETEHNEWMETKIKNGWKYGSPRNDKNKIHDCLISYHLLSEKTKDKDRNAVRHYPEILKNAGYKIVSNLV